MVRFSKAACKQKSGALDKTATTIASATGNLVQGIVALRGRHAFCQNIGDQQGRM
jgi:hypothetical protein